MPPTEPKAYREHEPAIMCRWRTEDSKAKVTEAHINATAHLIKYYRNVKELPNKS